MGGYSPVHFRYKPGIFTGIPGIKHYLPQAVPVVLKLCRLAGIASVVDRMARWEVEPQGRPGDEAALR